MCRLFPAKDDQGLNEAAIDATNKLKFSLTNEREIRLKLQAENELLQVIIKRYLKNCHER